MTRWTQVSPLLTLAAALAVSSGCAGHRVLPDDGDGDTGADDVDDDGWKDGWQPRPDVLHDPDGSGPEEASTDGTGAPEGTDEGDTSDENDTWDEGDTWGDDSSGSTPLVLSFDGERVRFVADDSAGFIVSPTKSTVTDWPTASTPWLALDRDGNDSIDDGGELFGSLTRMASGNFAPNGFVALAELDDDGDGQLTDSDGVWAELRAWSDHDGDRASSTDELVPLADLGLTSIDLDYRIERACDNRGNCEVERARFTFVDAEGIEQTGDVVDVHLRHR